MLPYFIKTTEKILYGFGFGLGMRLSFNTVPININNNSQKIENCSQFVSISVRVRVRVVGRAGTECVVVGDRARGGGGQSAVWWGAEWRYS